MKNIIKSVLKYFGLNVSKRNTTTDKELLHSKQLLTNEIDLVLDVGANIGQYANGIIENGYKGDIWSIEPLPNEFLILKKKSEKYKCWKVFNCAFGLKDSEGYINYYKKESVISSILEFHSDFNHQAEVIKEKIKIVNGDNFLKHQPTRHKNIFLKIDCQGYEKFILDGLKKSIKYFKGIKIETSIQNTYNGESKYYEIIQFFRNLDYELWSVENIAMDQTKGRFKQIDLTFFKIQL